MNAEIQIQFPRPGEWEEFTLTPIYQDKGGYRPPAHFTQDEIPADQAPAMAAVVSALVSLIGFGQIANAAHVGGLLIGCLTGLLGGLWARRKQAK